MASLQVLIVGAGPTGLMMALVLHRYQVPFRIVDKKKGITSYSKALGMHARTLEVFRDFQLDQKIINRGNPLQTLELYKGDERIAAIYFGNLETKYPYILGIAQSETEAVMEEALREKGVHVEWETEVIEVMDEGKHMRASCLHKGNVSHNNYFWVIGCDGFHSVVREQTHIPFVGTSHEARFAVADVTVEKGFDRAKTRGMIAKEGMMLILPFGKDRTRVVIERCMLPHHTVPSLEYVNEMLQTRVKKDFVVKELTWSSVFQITYKKATRFSKGRCFIAGDAAHVHSPIGGQGMNTGLQDAYNLGWKLGLVYHAHARPSLLMTYHEERERTAKQLLRITHIMTNIGTAGGPVFQFLRPYIIRAVFGIKKLHAKIVFRMSQLAVNYRGMSLSKEYPAFSWMWSSSAWRAAPRAGERVIDHALQVMNHPEYLTLCDYLRGGSFHLLLFLTDAYSEYQEQIRALCKLTTHYPQLSIGCVVYQMADPTRNKCSGEILIDAIGSLHIRYGALRPCMYLIRPDKYIGMRSSKISCDHVKEYLKRIIC